MRAIPCAARRTIIVVDKVSGPGRKTLKVLVAVPQVITLSDVVLVEAVDDYLLPGVQSQVRLRDGAELLTTTPAGEIAEALRFAYPHLLMAPIAGGGGRPAWETYRGVLEQEARYG